MPASPLNAPLADNRRHTRLSSRKAAFIGGPAGPIPVNISNWSAAGARLDFERPVRLPPEFKLLLGPREHGGDPAIRCRLRWLDGASAGVSFY